MKTKRPRAKKTMGILFLLLAALLLCASCKSNDHMYRHNRSHCDCPTF